MNSYQRSAPGVVTVGIDGSGGDRRAIAWGVRAARAHRLPVRLLHAHPHAYDMTVTERLAAAEHLARAQDPDAVIRAVATTGRPVEVLMEESTKAGMLVLAPHTGEPLDGFCWSTTTMVASSADCPVVAVPRAGRDLPDDGPVLVGIDGTAVSEAALAFAFEHAAAVGAGLTAVHCWQDTAEDEVSWHPAGIGEAPMVETEQRVLAERLAGWQERYPQVTIDRVVARGRPARALLERAAMARLLVVGSTGRSGLSGLLHGSTSQALLYELPCPVAIVRGTPDDGAVGRNEC